jgi:hypothetical protein
LAKDIQFRDEGALNGPARYPTPDSEGNEPAAEDFARYTRELWDEQEDALRPLHDVWTQNLLFLSNRQWWEQKRDGTWGPVAQAEWKEQPVSNLCLAYFKTFLAKATKNRPAWQVIPASSEPNDIDAAVLAENVLESKWTELRLQRVIRRAIAWTISTGNCFLLPYWNTNTGKMVALTEMVEVPVFNPETGEQMMNTDEMGNPTGPMMEEVECPCDENGDPILTPDGRPDLEAEPAMIDQGDVGARVYSPFQVRVNPTAETEEDVTWLIVAEVVPVEDLKADYPDRASLIKPDDIGRLADYDRMIGSITGGPDTQLTTPYDERARDIPRALKLHYHEKPSPAFPNGRYWCVCNSDVLLEDPSDLPDNLWPAMIHMTDLPVPGRYYAMATLESIIGLNREYNEINAQVKEHHNLMTRGKWIVERGTGIKKGQITTQPGEVIQVNTGFIAGVKQLDIRGLPGEVYGERDRVISDFEFVSGIHKASMGSPPPGVTAGVAFLQLQEADDTDLGPFLAMLEEAIAELAGAILQIIKNRYTDARLIYVAGPNRRFMVKAFRGADLESCVDVVPIAESSMPWSRTARQSALIDMAKNLPGLFMDPVTGMFDTQRFAQLLPMGGLEALNLQEDLDVQEAMREEEMFEGFGVASNELPMVEFWQNHVVHSNTHKRILKSAKFKQWAPEAQELFKQHVMEHDMALLPPPMPTDPNAPPGEESAGPPPMGGGGPPMGAQPMQARDLDPEADQPF